MPALTIILDGDGAFPDLIDRWDDVIHLGNDAPPITITGLVGGMTSGRPSLMLRLDLPNGKVVIAETSWALFHAAHMAFAAKFGVPE